MESSVKQLSYEEITAHLLTDDKPSDFMNDISKTEEFAKYPFRLLLEQKNTEQSKKYHPEGSVWNHTMLVLDEAAKVRNRSKNSKVFMWAALLHDIGKPSTTRVRKDKITSYDHDKAGEKLCNEFLHSLTDDEDFIQQTSSLVRYHMHILYVLKDLPFKDIKGLIKNVDIYEISLLCRCDRMGRVGVDEQTEDADYQAFLDTLERYLKDSNDKR